MLSRLIGRRSARPASPPTPCRLRLEVLEDREVPTIIFGLVGHRILVFNAADPRVVLNALPISGLLAPTERIMNIDVRPGVGGLYGWSNFGRMYLINPQSGFSLVVGSGAPILTNAVHNGFDFNPATNQVRVVSNPGQNLRIDPNFATLVATDNNLSYRVGDVNQGAAPRVTGLANSNNFVFPPFSITYGIDHKRNALVVVGNPSANDGQLTTIGSLGVNVVARVGFDIVTLENTVNVAYAALQRSGQQFSLLYGVDLATGALTRIGPVGNLRLVTDIAVDLRNTSGFGFPGLSSGPLVPLGGSGGSTGGGGGFGGFGQAPGQPPGASAPPPVTSLPPPDTSPGPPPRNGRPDPAPGVLPAAADTPDWFDHDPILVG
jgi:hypothetical protein